MAEPTSQYYVFQYLNNHNQRYQMMYNLALQEVQADYTARVAQQQKLIDERDKLATYITNLERDLTSYIKDKGASSQVDADRELALMRMYIDVEKAKASQISQAQARRQDAEKLVSQKYQVTTTMNKNIIDADTAIADGAALAPNQDQLTNLIRTNVTSIVVPNRGTGSALAAAQQLHSKITDTVNRKGVSGIYDEATVKQIIADHYGLANFSPPKSKVKGEADFAPSSDPFNYELGSMEAYEKAQLKKTTGTPATGGLSKQARDIKTQLDAARGDKAQKVAKEGIEILKASPDYGILLRSLSDDGKISEEERKLFRDRMEDGQSAAEFTYNVLKEGQRAGQLDPKKMSVEDQLIFDDQFLRKLGSLDSAAVRQTEVVTKLKEEVKAPTFDDVTTRARELYSPIRQAGSPAFRTYQLTDPATGQTFQATGQDILDMQKEFEQVLIDNPAVKQNFEAVERGFQLADRINLKGPGAAISRQSPEYIGYQLYSQYKQNPSAFTADKITELSQQLTTSNAESIDALAYFHAYNIKATTPEAPHDSTQAIQKTRDRLFEEARRESEMLAEERGKIQQKIEEQEGIQKDRGFMFGIFDDKKQKEKRKAAGVEKDRLLEELENEKLLLERIYTKPEQPTIDELGGPGDETEPVVKAPKPDTKAEMEKAMALAPQVVAGTLDGGEKSWLFDPADNKVYYIFGDEEKTRSSKYVYNVADLLDGKVGTPFAQQWAKSQAAEIYQAIEAQKVFEAEQSVEDLEQER